MNGIVPPKVYCKYGKHFVTYVDPSERWAIAKALLAELATVNRAGAEELRRVWTGTLPCVDCIEKEAIAKGVEMV